MTENISNEEKIRKLEERILELETKMKLVYKYFINEEIIERCLSCSTDYLRTEMYDYYGSLTCRNCHEKEDLKDEKRKRRKTGYI